MREIENILNLKECPLVLDRLSGCKALISSLFKTIYKKVLKRDMRFSIKYYSSYQMPKGSGKDKWFSINWRVANAKVKQCQEEIAVAWKAKDL
jgi:hypothetical protein